MSPDLRFEVAHGQLEESELENRMMTFLRGDVDVLVCTSIIESGIDIPAANTLIVEHADHFGLSQLYQIRGRVGRSRERAYAYLLYDSAASLTPQAAQRLAALSDFTELGSGFQVAMRDLELRGAGNLLGDEQSGPRRRARLRALHADARRGARGGARAESGGDGEREWEPVRVDVDVDAYVPAEYVGYEQAKIDVHRRIAGAREVADIEELRAELADRFGAAARAGRAPAGAAERADQARGRRRARRQLPRRAARDHADRAGLRGRCASCAGACRRRSTTPAARR